MDPNRQTAKPPNRQTRRRRAAGFTLIEAALTTIIVGTGVLAIVAAQQAYHQKNGWAQHTGTALLLANEIRELTLPLPLHDPQTNDAVLGHEADETNYAAYDDLDDFAGLVTGGRGAGLTINPPINALGEEIGEMDSWTQFVTVEGVPPGNIATNYTDLYTLYDPDMVRVTVQVLYQGPLDDEPKGVTELSWIVPKK